MHSNPSDRTKVLELWSLSEGYNYVSLSAAGPNNLSSLLKPWTVSFMTDLCVYFLIFVFSKTRAEWVC
jgi:hypothetical protein